MVVRVCAATSQIGDVSERCLSLFKVPTSSTPLLGPLFNHERVYVLFYLLYAQLLTYVNTVRFLNLVRPFLPFLPEVSSPDRKV